MSDVANSTNQIQFCLFASGGKISAPATRSLFTFPMNSTLNFPPLTGTHDATRKANLPWAVHLELIHYHVLVCIIIFYKPQGNIIILLSPSELKSDFVSIETPWSGVNCHNFISYGKSSLQVKRQLHIPFRDWLFQKMAAALNVYCLPAFLLHMTILKIF